MNDDDDDDVVGRSKIILVYVPRCARFETRTTKNDDRDRRCNVENGTKKRTEKQ